MTGSEHFKTSDEQMDKIQLGFRNGLTEEQVQQYTDPKFELGQMLQIRKGLENGLSEKKNKIIC